MNNETHAPPDEASMQLPAPDWQPPEHWLAAGSSAEIRAGWIARGFTHESERMLVDCDARDWTKWKADPAGYRAAQIARDRRDIDDQAARIREIAARHGLAPRVVRAVLVEHLWDVDEYEFPAGQAIKDMRRAGLG